MKELKIILIAAICCMVSCNSEPNMPFDARDKLVGEWDMMYIIGQDSYKDIVSIRYDIDNMDRVLVSGVFRKTSGTIKQMGNVYNLKLDEFDYINIRYEDIELYTNNNSGELSGSAYGRYNISGVEFEDRVEISGRKIKLK